MISVTVRKELGKEYEVHNHYCSSEILNRYPNFISYILNFLHMQWILFFILTLLITSSDNMWASTKWDSAHKHGGSKIISLLVQGISASRIWLLASPMASWNPTLKSWWINPTSLQCSIMPLYHCLQKHTGPNKS